MASGWQSIPGCTATVALVRGILAKRWVRFGIVGGAASVSYFLLGLLFVSVLGLPTLAGNEAFIQWKDGLVVDGEVGPASKDFAQNIMNNFIAWVKQTAKK